MKEGTGTRGRVSSARWAGFLSPLVLLFLWWVTSLFFKPDYLPGPERVALAFGANLAEGEVFSHVAASLRRVVIGLILALGLGTGVGIGMGYHPYAAAAGERWVSVGLSIPSLCWAYVSLMFFGLAEMGVYFATLMIVFPFIATDVWEGMKALDPKLLEMAGAFQFRRGLVLRHVVLPQLLPHFLSALRYGFGLSWKVTVVAELVGQQNGVGYMFGKAFGLFSMPQVLAWTGTFVLLMMGIELLLLKGLEARWTRWRRAVSF